MAFSDGHFFLFLRYFSARCIHPFTTDRSRRARGRRGRGADARRSPRQRHSLAGATAQGRSGTPKWEQVEFSAPKQCMLCSIAMRLRMGTEREGEHFCCALVFSVPRCRDIVLLGPRIRFRFFFVQILVCFSCARVHIFYLLRAIFIHNHLFIATHTHTQVGTSSLRRRALLARLHAHLKVADIRGNLQTRYVGFSCFSGFRVFRFEVFEFLHPPILRHRLPLCLRAACFHLKT